MESSHHLEESKEPSDQQVTEFDGSRDIKELVIDLETGVPSDEITSLCMECQE